MNQPDHTRSIRRAASSLVLALFLMLGGCRSHTSKLGAFTEAWTAGETERAAAIISEMGGTAPARDKVVFRLEEGAVMQALDRIGESDLAFLDAESRIEEYEERARIRIASEAGALLSNQDSLPYEGRSHEKIMLNAYLALNRLSQQDYQGAAVELRRAYNRQQQAVEENARRLEKAREEFEAKGGRYEAVVLDERAAPAIARIEQRFRSTESYKVYSDYVNPFVEYLQLIFLMAQRQELENLPMLGKRLEGMLGAPPMKAEVGQIVRLLQGEPLEPATYLFVETGRAPWLEQIQIQLPAHFIDPQLPYVAAALPVPVYEDDFVSDFQLAGSDGAASSATLLADFDSIFATELRNRYPSIVIRSLLSSAARSAADYVARDQMGTAGLLMGLAYQVGANIADTRSWTTLPKQILMARIPTPGDGIVRIRSESQGLDQEIVLEPDAMHVVVARIVSSRTGIVSLRRMRLDDPRLPSATPAAIR